MFHVEQLREIIREVKPSHASISPMSNHWKIALFHQRSVLFVFLKGNKKEGNRSWCHSGDARGLAYGARSDVFKFLPNLLRETDDSVIRKGCRNRSCFH